MSICCPDSVNIRAAYYCACLMESAIERMLGGLILKSTSMQKSVSASESCASNFTSYLPCTSAALDHACVSNVEHCPFALLAQWQHNWPADSAVACWEHVLAIISYHWKSSPLSAHRWSYGRQCLLIDNIQRARLYGALGLGAQVPRSLENRSPHELYSNIQNSFWYSF